MDVTAVGQWRRGNTLTTTPWIGSMQVYVLGVGRNAGQPLVYCQEFFAQPLRVKRNAQYR